MSGIPIHTSRVTAGSESIAVSHEYINCDGPYCQEPQNENPKFSCSSCHRHYYCGKECQKQAWPTHKKWCKETVNLHMEVLPQAKEKGTQVEAAINTECGICLEPLTTPANNNVNVNPKSSSISSSVVVLKTCRHGFCFQCIKTWEKRQVSCPICRQSDANVDMAIVDNAQVYLQRATIQAADQDKKTIYELALEELDILCKGQKEGDIDMQEFKSNPVLQLALYVRAQAYSAMGNYQGTIDYSNWILDNHLYASFAYLLDCKLLKAKACLKSGDIEAAITICFDVVEAFHERQVASFIVTDCYKLHAQCWYEVGNWDFCIRASQGASHTERHHNGVHKHWALGEKAEGETARAVEIMSEAVLYEVDVGQGDMEENIRLLKQFQANLETEQKTGIDLSYKGPEPLSRCGICKATEGNCELGRCKHTFCYECIRDWWIEYIRETSKNDNQDAYYKGPDASCPSCRNGK